MASYVALIHKDSGSDYGVSFPDLPGCVAAGSDLEDARTMAVEALALHLAGMAEDGEAIPEPSSLDRIMGDLENRDGVAILVQAQTKPRKIIRVNITLAEEDLERIDAHAARLGMTRSGFLVASAKRALQ